MFLNQLDLRVKFNTQITQINRADSNAFDNMDHQKICVFNQRDLWVRFNTQISRINRAESNTFDNIDHQKICVYKSV